MKLYDASVAIAIVGGLLVMGFANLMRKDPPPPPEPAYVNPWVQQARMKARERELAAKAAAAKKDEPAEGASE